MRGEGDGCLGSAAFGNLFKRGANIRDLCLDETGMIVESAQLFYARRLWPNRPACTFDVFEILATTRIRAIGGGHKSQRLLHSILSHFTQCVGKQWMPVAVAEINGKMWPLRFHYLVQRCNQLSVFCIYRTDTAKQFVVFSNSKHSLARHIPPAQNILEERNDVGHSLRSAKRHDHNRVVG